MYDADRVPAAAGYHSWITSDRGCLRASGSRRARSVSAIDRVPTWNAPVGAGTSSAALGEEPGAVVAYPMRDSDRTLRWLARSSLRLRSPLIPSAGPTKAEIVSPVVDVMSA